MGDPSRRRKSPPFVMVYHKWMDTEAWHHLSGIGAKLLLGLLRRYNGDNNGRIAFSIRDAAEAIGASRNTIAGAFAELEDKGFIRPARKGSFSQKQRMATEWRLTMWPAFGKAASHQYQAWKAPNRDF